MVALRLSEGNDYFDSYLVRENGETGNIIHGRGGNDTIIGNGYPDVITGDSGNDWLEGGGGSDILVGGSGTDSLQGGNGDDFIHGGSESDSLYRGLGADTLYGGTGDDEYVFFRSDGSLDIINDDKSETTQPGYGGGVDYVWAGDIDAQDIRLVQNNSDLYISDVADLSDGTADRGVLVENFFLGGNNVVEYLIAADGTSYFDLASLIA